MLMFTSVVPRGEPVEASLSLPLSHDQRRRARLRLSLPSGDVGLALPRGTPLVAGDCVRSDDGTVARIEAAPEQLSRASTADPHLLARAAYHLGNRHVALSIQPRSLSYPHDHVLDGLCRELGLTVEAVFAPFEPEPGGYGQSRAHGHEHRHEHEHGEEQ